MACEGWVSPLPVERAAATISFSDMVYWFLRLRKYARHSVVSLLTTPTRASRRAANGHELSYTIASIRLTPRFFFHAFLPSFLPWPSPLPPKQQKDKERKFYGNVLLLGWFWCSTWWRFYLYLVRLFFGWTLFVYHAFSITVIEFYFLGAVLIFWCMLMLC